MNALLADKFDAVRTYNEVIKIVRRVNDQVIVDLLTKILKMEEDHFDWAEIQRAEID